MTERQFQTIRWAVIFAVLAAIVLTFMGCQYSHATEPTTFLLDSLIKNECRKLGLDVEVRFWDEDRLVNPEIYGEYGSEPRPACMAAGKGYVVVYPNCADEDWTDPNIINAARHECCHILMGHYMTPDMAHNQQIEVEAQQCVTERF